MSCSHLLIDMGHDTPINKTLLDTVYGHSEDELLWYHFCHDPTYGLWLIPDRGTQIILPNPNSDYNHLITYRNFGRVSSVLLTSHLQLKSPANQQTNHKYRYVHTWVNKVTAAVLPPNKHHIRTEYPNSDLVSHIEHIHMTQKLITSTHTHNMSTDL